MWRSSISLGVLLTAMAGRLPGQTSPADGGQVTIPDTRVYSLHSSRADATFQVRIAEPADVPGHLPDQPLQVLYLLDADLFFGTVVELTRLMSRLHGEIPPTLVVGIGYGDPPPPLQAELRARDFTPTADARMAQPLPGVPDPILPEGRRFGGASAFLGFLADEVKPWIDAEYPEARGRSALFGSSLGGLFVLYAMLERPRLFDGYIAVSPALWWDNRVLLRHEAVRGTSQSELATHLFLAVGELEEDPRIPSLAPFRMVSNVVRFAALLDGGGRESLEVETLVAGGETHTTVVPVGLTRGLRFLRSRWAGGG